MILVTGATGLVGGNLMWQLLQKNDRVVAIRRATSKLESLYSIFSFYTSNPDAYLARIDWRIADVLDLELLNAVMQEITVVYHCAAVVSFADNADILLDTNVIGTRNVVEAALKHGVTKLCFVSSIAACGHEKDNKQIDENSIWEDSESRSLYSRSKFYSELEVWLGIEKGLKAVIVNPGIILGVSGTNNGSSQLFSQVRKGLPFYTNGGSGYVDVRDVVAAIIQLTNSVVSGERFILVSENCSNKDVLSWMSDGFGKRRPFIGIGKRTLVLVGCVSEILGKLFRFNPLIDRSTARTATNRQYYSNTKIKTALDFQFTSVESCILEVCQYLNQRK